MNSNKKSGGGGGGGGASKSGLLSMGTHRGRRETVTVANSLGQGAFLPWNRLQPQLDGVNNVINEPETRPGPRAAVSAEQGGVGMAEGSEQEVPAATGAKEKGKKVDKDVVRKCPADVRLVLDQAAKMGVRQDVVEAVARRYLAIVS